MKKVPLFLKWSRSIGFAIMGIDPYAKIQANNPEFQDTSPQVNRQEPLKKGTSDPTTQTAWISTADELPEYYKTVVLFTADKEILHDYARVNDGREDFYIHPKDPRTLVPNEVTHWMSLGTPTP